MLHDIKDYFYFTRSEKRGILVLCFLILFSIFIPDIYAWYTTDKEMQNFESLLKENVCYLQDLNVADTDSTTRRDYPYHTEDSRGKGTFCKDRLPTYSGPVFDLNTADSLDLLSLPGIGPYFAKAILRYRERLGGYVAVNQLLEVYGMDKEKLQKIKHRITVDTSGLKKLPVNTADFKTIMKHPYCNYQIAKALVKFRQQYGVITALDELIKSGIIPDSLYRKIFPYLSVK